MLRKATKQSIAIGLVIGLSVAGAAFASMHWWQKKNSTVGQPVAAPCLIAGIESGSVTCRIGPQTARVVVGTYFPDGRFLLDAVDPANRGFTATHIITRRTIVFQADHKLVIPQLGVIPK